MEEPRSVVVRRVDWGELFPWLRLVRAAVVALGGRVWITVIAALLVTEGGRLAIEGLVRTGEPLPALPQAGGIVFGKAARVLREQTSVSRFGHGAALGFREAWPEPGKGERVQTRPIPVVGVWGDFAQGFLYFVGVPSTERTWLNWGKRLVYLVWVLAVWTLAGGIILRLTALRIARGESPGLGELLRFVRRRWGAGLACTLGGWVAILICSGICGGIGLAAWWLGHRLLPLWLLWPLSFLPGVLLTVVVILVALGWPLMLASVVIDGQDGYGAVGAAGSYIFRRPFHVIWYVLVAGLVGGAFALLLEVFIEGLIPLLLWSVGRSVPISVFDELVRDPNVEWWNEILRQLVWVYLYGQFWTSVAIVYMLLRRDVDDTDLGELAEEEVTCGDPPDGNKKNDSA